MLASKALLASSNRDYDDDEDDDEKDTSSFPSVSVWTAWLPGWGCNKEALELSKGFHERGGTEPISERCSCGPAVLWAAKGALAVWIPHLLLPWLARPYTVCAHHRAAVIPTWLLAGTAPFVLFAFWCEWHAMGYVVITQVQSMAPFKVGGVKTPFLQWFMAYSAMSVTLMYDVIKNGLFLALILSTLSDCEDSTEYQRMWKTTLHQSVVPTFLQAPLHYYGVFFWLLTFIQVIFACSAAIPWKLFSPPDYSLKTVDDAQRCAEGHWPTLKSLMYPTASVGRQNHGRAVQAVATVARMELVTSPDAACARQKIAFYMDKKGDYASAIRQLDSLIRTFNHRIILSGILDSAAQLTIQVTINAIFSKVNGKLWATQTNLAVGFGFLGAWYLGYNAIMFRSWAGKGLRAISDRIDEHLQGNATTEWKCGDTADNIKTKLLLPANEILNYFTVGLVFYFVLVIFNMVKFFMVYYCPDSLWNVTGCAVLH